MRRAQTVAARCGVDLRRVGTSAIRIIEIIRSEAGSFEPIREAAAAEAAADPLFWVDRDYCHRYLRQIPFIEPKALDELGQAQLVLRVHCRRRRDPDFDSLFRRLETFKKRISREDGDYYCGIPITLLTNTPESYRMRSDDAMRRLSEAEDVGAVTRSCIFDKILAGLYKENKAHAMAGADPMEIAKRTREFDLTTSIVVAHLLRNAGSTPRTRLLTSRWSVTCHLEDPSKFVDAVRTVVRRWITSGRDAEWDCYLIRRSQWERTTYWWTLDGAAPSGPTF